jgi:hypothetical protein
VGLVGLAEDRVEVDLGHVGPGQVKYLDTARVAPGVGQGHSGCRPVPLRVLRWHFYGSPHRGLVGSLESR